MRPHGPSVAAQAWGSSVEYRQNERQASKRLSETLILEATEITALLWVVSVFLKSKYYRKWAEINDCSQEQMTHSCRPRRRRGAAPENQGKIDETRLHKIIAAGGFNMVRLMKNDGKTSMTMIVDGHEVSLHFAEEPNVQIALKIKQALLGTLLTEKE